VVDVGAAFPAFGQAPELVEQGQSLFDDPAHRLVVIAVPRRLISGRIPR
jgi:hypothetical protein